MKILTEYKSKKEPNTLNADIVYGYTIKNFRKGEAVGIYLKQIYPSTVDLIESLLYFKHPLTLKHDGVQYKLYCLDDWKKTYQDPKDQLKTKTDKHPLYQIYLDNRKEYAEKKNAKKLTEQYEIIFDNFELPKEEEMDKFIQDTAPLYEVDVDYTDNLSKYRAYVQLKYYLEHDFEYSRPANAEFIMPVGNQTYLEDLIYKNNVSN